MKTQWMRSSKEMQGRQLNAAFLFLLLCSLLFSIALPVAAQSAVSSIITVNSTADPGDGVCDQAECTLREAIVLANGTAERQTIAFNIPGPGPHTIQPSSALPTITDAVIMDGYSQPGAQPNTNPITAGTNAQIKIGLNFASQERKLHLAADGSIVRGLAINGAYGEGIYVAGRANQIVGNFIGVDYTGTAARPNGIGIGIAEGSAGTIIGGVHPSARNLISGNRGIGILLIAQPDIVIQGNFIGIDSSGQRALGNRTGIQFGSNYSVERWPMYVGGATTEERNVISGNYTAMQLLYGRVFVQNNYIGTDVTGTAPLGNTAIGIDMVGFAHRIYNNLIAYNEYGIWNANFDGPDYNLIAYNTIVSNKKGISVPRGRAEIRENSIYNNEILGIDLGNDGPTLNDPSDLDSGPNDLLNFPLVHVAANDGQEISVYTELVSQPNRTYHLSFYANSSCFGYGQGQIFLGTLPASLGSTGRSSFAFNLPVAIPPGYGISATASEAINTPPGPAVITSEFAPCRQLSALVNEHLQVVAMGYQYVPFAQYPHPSAPGGRFDLTVTFRNNSVYTLHHLMLKVATLTNNNVVFGSISGETAGEGALFLTPDWAPGETRAFTFWIGLQERIPFDFYMDIYALKTKTLAAGAPADLPVDEISAEQPRLGYHFDRAAIEDADATAGATLYLPLVNR